jgi:hypothetical protein
MAILSPADLPVVIKVHSQEMKAYVLHKLGHPHVNVEMSEAQFEQIYKICGDFIAGYMPHEQRLGLFWTQPLKNTYPMPADAYWIQEVSWDASISNPADVFGAENFMFNIGNVMGSSTTLLLDYHMLQSYRKWVGRVLASEGRWEVLNEVNGDTTKQLIRLYPTPKGAFPVVVKYVPVMSHFRSVQAKMLAYDMMVAEAKIAVGLARRKIANMPEPGGGSISLDGSELVQEGEKARDELIEKAISLGEPLGVYLMSLFFVIGLVHMLCQSMA